VTNQQIYQTVKDGILRCQLSSDCLANPAFYASLSSVTP